MYLARASWGLLASIRPRAYHAGNDSISGGDLMPPHRHAYRPTIMGTRGAVASAHPLASMSGIRVLLEGGNAVDAAGAVAATLNLVTAIMSGAAGVGVVLFSSARTREAHR